MGIKLMSQPARYSLRAVLCVDHPKGPMGRERSEQSQGESVHTDIKKPAGHPHSCQLLPAPAFSESPFPEEHQHKTRSQLSPSVSKLSSQEGNGSSTCVLSRVCSKICLHMGTSVLCLRRSALPVPLRVCQVP